MVYIVKLYIDDWSPFYTSRGYRLFIGENEIKKYAGFRHGLFFKVYDPDFLAENVGKMIRFSVDGVDFSDTGVRLPDHSVGVLAAASLTDDGGLPTQEQVLAE
ncbi:MAG: hypothetical protein ACRERU_02225 [Methylococcales bacterium]